jgi:hypothetical protein
VLGNLELIIEKVLAEDCAVPSDWLINVFLKMPQLKQDINTTCLDLASLAGDHLFLASLVQTYDRKAQSSASAGQQKTESVHHSMGQSTTQQKLSHHSARE